MSDVLYLIGEKSEEMTPSLRIVAKYMQNNIDSVAFDTLDNVAAKIKVSTTSVIRFARFLGFDGFSAMQKAIQAGLQEHLRLPNRLENTIGKIKKDSLCMESYQNDINNINQTMKSIPEATIIKAENLIIKASSVYILGLRASFALAHYMYSRLSQIKSNISLVQPISEMYIEDIAKLTSKDVCICYLFPRYTASCITILKLLHKRKVPIVLITDQYNSHVKGCATVMLHCNVTGVSFKNTFAAPLALTNYLTASIANKNYKEAKVMLNELETLITDGQFMK